MSLPHAHIWLSTKFKPSSNPTLDSSLGPLEKTSFISAVKPGVGAFLRLATGDHKGELLHKYEKYGAIVKVALIIHRALECVSREFDNPDSNSIRKCMGEFGLKMAAQAVCEVVATYAGVPYFLAMPGCFIAGREGVQFWLDVSNSQFDPIRTAFRVSKDLLVKPVELMMHSHIGGDGYYITAALESSILYQSENIIRFIEGFASSLKEEIANIPHISTTQDYTAKIEETDRTSGAYFDGIPICTGTIINKSGEANIIEEAY